MYHTLYDPEGNMFEVTAARVRKLLALNWTLSYPEDLSGVFKNGESEVSDTDGDTDADEKTEKRTE